MSNKETNNLNGVYKVKLNDNGEGGYDIDVDDLVEAKGNQILWPLINSILIVALVIFVLWLYNVAQDKEQSTKNLAENITANKEKLLSNQSKIDENSVKYENLQNEIKLLREANEKIQNEVKSLSEESQKQQEKINAKQESKELKKQQRNADKYYNIEKSKVPKTKIVDQKTPEVPATDQKIPEVPALDQKIPEIPVVNQDVPKVAL